jgi:hypothetical protein
VGTRRLLPQADRYAPACTVQAEAASAAVPTP